MKSYQWMKRLPEVSDTIYADCDYARGRIAELHDALADAKADLDEQIARAEARIARLWTPEEIAAAKAGER